MSEKEFLVKSSLILIVISVILFLGINVCGKGSFMHELLFFLECIVVVVGIAVWITTVGYFMVCFFARVSGKIRNPIEGLDKDDFQKNKEYYREILDKYSPITLGYIDSMRLKKNHLIAELLWLKNKGIIAIENGKIKKETTSAEISSCEKIVLDEIKDGVFKVEKFSSFEDKVENDLDENCLIAMKLIRFRFTMKQFEIAFWILIFLCCAFFGLSNILDEWGVSKEALNSLYNLGILSAILLLVTACIYLLPRIFVVNYYEVRGKKYKRTRRGRDINKKLEGLKSFLQDYSMLSEREAKEVELWEDYLIYSVMFGQNKKIIEEYEKYIEIN